MKEVCTYEEITDPVKLGGFAKLYSLWSEGIPLPDSFFIMSSAYFDFIRSNNMLEFIDSNLHTLDLSDPEQLQNKANTIQREIFSHEIDSALRAEIIKYFQSIERDDIDSSGLVQMSRDLHLVVSCRFTGYDSKTKPVTYLHVNGADQLYKAILSCWASLFTADSIKEREKLGLGHSDIGVVVAVEKMLSPSKSGKINFTSASDNNFSIVISACFGVPEVILQNVDNYDEYVVNLQSKKILSKNMGNQKYTYFRDRRLKKIVKRKVFEHESRIQKLSDEKILYLTELSKKIIELFDEDQQIIFMVQDNKVYIINSYSIQSQNGRVVISEKPMADKTNFFDFSVSDAFQLLEKEDTEQQEIDGPKLLGVSKDSSNKPFTIFQYDLQDNTLGTGPNDATLNSILLKLVNDLYGIIYSKMLAKYNSLFSKPPLSLRDLLTVLEEKGFIEEEFIKKIKLLNKYELNKPDILNYIDINELILMVRQTLKRLS